MSKFTKGFCRFAGIMISFGIVMLIVGFCMGGRPQGLSIGWHNGPVLRRTEVGAGTGRSGTATTVPIDNADSIRELEVNIGAASVEIRTGSAFGLEVIGVEDYESTVQDGVWTLSNDSAQLHISIFSDSEEPRFVITVPENFSFDNLSLDIGAGALQATGLRAVEAVVSVGAGSMKLLDFKVTNNTDMHVGMGALTVNGALNGYSYIDCGMGSVKLQLERPADYGYTASCGMGSVKIDGKGTSGMGTDIENNTDASTLYDINCGMGSVKIEFNGAASDNAGEATESTAPAAIEAPTPPAAPAAPAAPKAPAAPAAPKAPAAP